MLLGAGRSFGNGGDDFGWLDVWRVSAGPGAADVTGDPLPAFEGESLFLAKAESASAWVGRVGGEYVWHQAGD